MTKLVTVAFSLFKIFLAVFFALHSIHGIIQISYGFKNLIPHRSILEQKVIVTVKGKYDHVTKKMKIKLHDNNNIYILSGYVDRTDRIINPGDSITVYTKPNISLFGNLISDANTMWTTREVNEIYHLLDDEYIIVNYDDHIEIVLIFTVFFTALAVLALIWYYKRSKPRIWIEI